MRKRTPTNAFFAPCTQHTTSNVSEWMVKVPNGRSARAWYECGLAPTAEIRVTRRARGWLDCARRRTVGGLRARDGRRSARSWLDVRHFRPGLYELCARRRGDSGVNVRNHRSE